MFKRLHESVDRPPLIPMSERTQRAVLNVAGVLAIASALLMVPVGAAFVADGEPLFGIVVLLIAVGVVATIFLGVRVRLADRAAYYGVFAGALGLVLLLSLIGLPGVAVVVSGSAVLVVPQVFNLRYSRATEQRAP